MNFEDLEDARSSGLNVVAIGGGTGLSAMLRGLKLCTENITAVVTVADDGGGSGMLRNDLGILPPGDIRNCILALANTEPVMEKLLNYRFKEGSMAGQSFGNLFLAALTGISENFDEAITRMSDVLAVTGRVLPVTHENVYLEAEFENGTKVLGESQISSFKKIQKCRVRRVYLTPDQPKAHPEVIRAIQAAELIVLGPGSLYTSVIPNLLVDGVSEAISQSGALKVYVCNVMTQGGETESYSAFDHARAILSHARSKCIDVCLANDTVIPPELLKLYAAESAAATVVDRNLFADAKILLRERPLLSTTHGLVRHHPLRLALALWEIVQELRPRGSYFGDVDNDIIHWLHNELNRHDADL